MNPESIEKIRVEQDGDIIFMTMKLYKFFIAKRKEGSIDAMNLYFHYMFTARLQGETSIRADDIYIRNGIGFGKEKLKKAKAFLKRHGLIDYKQEKDADGHFTTRYIILKAGGSIFEPAGWFSGPPVDRPTGFGKQIPDLKKEIPDKRKGNAGFTKPSLEEVVSYMVSKGGTDKDGQKFFYHYESVGWHVGKKKMVSWTAAASGWLSREKKWSGEEEKLTFEEYRRKYGI